jgi:hypothetical protein
MMDQQQQQGSEAQAQQPSSSSSRDDGTEDVGSSSSSGSSSGSGSIVDDGSEGFESQWAAGGWLSENPLGVPTERENYVLSQGGKVFRVLLVKKQ